MKLAEVQVWMAAQADVSVGPRWGNPTWLANDRMLCWQRPLRKVDVAGFEDAGETPPDGDIVAITVSSLEEKEALLFASLPGFFTIKHFNGYPAVLVALAQARSVDVIPLLERMRLHLLSKPTQKTTKKTAKKTAEKSAEKSAQKSAKNKKR